MYESSTGRRLAHIWRCHRWVCVCVCACVWLCVHVHVFVSVSLRECVCVCLHDKYIYIS